MEAARTTTRSDRRTAVASMHLGGAAGRGALLLSLLLCQEIAGVGVWSGMGAGAAGQLRGMSERAGMFPEDCASACRPNKSATALLMRSAR